MSGITIKNMPIIIIALVVGAILTTSAIVPLVSDYSDDKTFTNEGVYYVNTSISDDVTITMNYDIENNVRSWYVDDVLLEYTLSSGFTPTVVGTDNLVFRTDGRARGLISSTGASDYTVTVTSESITTGANVGNAPLIVASTTPTGYVMRQSQTSDVYLLKTSDIVASGYTEIKVGADTNASVVISFKGNIKDGITVQTFNTNYDNLTVTDVAINATEVNGFVDLYKFNSVTFNVSYNDGDNNYVTACNYSVIAVPSSVTASTDNPDAYKALVSVLPMFAFIALIVCAASMLYIRGKN